MDTASRAPLPHPLTLALSAVAACSGAAALFTFFSLYSALPLRMERVEKLNESQDARLAELQSEAAQRREVLAAAMATLTQIDQRTRRIEDRILSK